MAFIESNRMSGVSGSIIRELFKMTAAPDMISFAGGNPSPDTFPMAEMAAIANDALLHRGASMLQYGFTEGFPPLRAAKLWKNLFKMLKSRAALTTR